jgi:hypothetical protein
MSRELLKRVRDTLHEIEETHYDLYWDIQAELNKPDLKREPLSDETIAKLWGESYSGTTQMVRNFARAIEKAHGIGVYDENHDA